MNNEIVEELNELSDGELSELQSRLKITPDMRIHVSINPIYKLEKINYRQISGSKPSGFWYGFGDEWIEWLEINKPEWKGEYIYNVDINGSNILQIKNCQEMIEFTKEYIDITHEYPGTYFIDWNRVTSRYDGIEINPYIWEARSKLNWYYFWDVASGCIWNFGKVKIELL